MKKVINIVIQSKLIFIVMRLHSKIHSINSISLSSTSVTTTDGFSLGMQDGCDLGASTMVDWSAQLMDSHWECKMAVRTRFVI